MKKTTRFVRNLTAASCAAALAACAGLGDVDNAWCPPEAAPAAAPTAVPAPAPAPAPAVVQEKITLRADALFRFDRSDARDILPQGKAELDRLAQRLAAGYARVDSIVLTGHTDRLGPDAYNQTLSQRRADTVMRYLQAHGVSGPMRAVGKGKADPVTTGCVGSKPTPALISCLQPDRRVEVLITGVKR